MVNALFSLLPTIAFIEVALLMKLVSRATESARWAGKSTKVIRSRRISDHWKEKVILAYSGRMFVGSILFLLGIILCAAAFTAVCFGLVALLGGEARLTDVMTDWAFLAGSVVFGVVYVLVRRICERRIRQS